MDIGKWRVFVRVSEMGSLSRAAVSLDTAQPVLSRQIRALEKECRGPLFHRNGRGVSLTQLGASILPRVKAWLAEAGQIEEEVRSGHRVVAGAVNIGMMGSTAHSLAHLLAIRVRQQFPAIKLHFLEGTSGQIEEWLSQGKLDIAVVFRGGGPRLSETALAHVAFHLIGPAGDRLTRGTTVNFSQISDLPLIMPGQPNSTRALLDQLAARHRIRLALAVEADSLFIQKNLVAHGLGYSILMRHSVQDGIEAGRLQSARIIKPEVRRTVVMVHTAHHPQSPAAKAMAELIKQIGDELTHAGIWR